MKRGIWLILLLTLLILSQGAERGEPRKEQIDWEAQGFVKMHTTAYILRGTTANGGTTRPGIAACNGHLGEVAVIYSIEGEYLRTVEITDVGGSPGMLAGVVIDCWEPDIEHAKAWMSQSGGRCYVQFIKGDG